MTFYKNFAAAYGTCWLATMALALLGQKHVDAGMIGFIGFPLISFVYALVKSGQSKTKQARQQMPSEVHSSPQPDATEAG